MSQTPLLRGGMMHAHGMPHVHHHNTQDHNHYRIQRENQQRHHQLQQQQHQQNYQHGQHHPFMMYGSSSSSTQQSYPTGPPRHGIAGQTPPAITNDHSNNNDPASSYPISPDHRHRFAPAPASAQTHNPAITSANNNHNHNLPVGGYQNQGALQQLEQNLRMVLQQQRHQHPRQVQHQQQQQQQQHQHYQSQRGMTAMLMSSSESSSYPDDVHVDGSVPPSTSTTTSTTTNSSRYQQQEQEQPPTTTNTTRNVVKPSHNHAVDERDQDHRDRDCNHHARFQKQHEHEQHIVEGQQQPNSSSATPAATTTTTDTATATDHQNKIIAQYQCFFGISPAPSITEDNCVSKQQQQYNTASPPSLSTSSSSASGSTSYNNHPTSSSCRLFALEADVQPLSISGCSTINSHSQQQKHQKLLSFSLSCSDLLGSWSEEVNNDFMMNKLFHSELKMSRDNKGNSLSTNRDSNQQEQHRQEKHLSSKRIDQSISTTETHAQANTHKEKLDQQHDGGAITPKQTKNNQDQSNNTPLLLSPLLARKTDTHRRNRPHTRPPPLKLPEIHSDTTTTATAAADGTTATTTTQTLLPLIQPKDRHHKKKMRKKKNNSKKQDGSSSKMSSSSKPKLRLKPHSKRKPRLGRKPKFPVLQQDPPIEQQILDLPAIVLSPSVLASIVREKAGGGDHRTSTTTSSSSNISYRTSIKTPTTRKRKHRDASSCISDEDDDDDGLSPHQFFCEILKSRDHDPNYSIELEETDYDVVPSPLQLASYGTHIAWAVQSSDSSLLRKLLGCGLSPNPCNQFRDNILGDLVCKQGNIPIYKCLVHEFNADLQVVDGFGRTPLHHCCWAHNLCRPIVEDILQRDPVQIFLKDKHDKTPLEYIRADAHLQGEWKTFLKEVADKYWPKGSELPRCLLSSANNTTPGPGGTNKNNNNYARRNRKPNGDLLDPPKALTPELAARLASGNITPEEIANMSELTRSKYGK